VHWLSVALCQQALTVPLPALLTGAAERGGAEAAGGHQEHPERAADQRQRVHLAGAALRDADEFHFQRHVAGGGLALPGLV
jgi:hypothetical protein